MRKLRIEQTNVVSPEAAAKVVHMAVFVIELVAILPHGIRFQVLQVRIAPDVPDSEFRCVFGTVEKVFTLVA